MLKNNKIWLILSTLSFVIIYLTSLDSNTLGIKTSVYLGLLYLCLTLIPNNLALILPANIKPGFNWLAKYKRDFGISAGLMFLTHSSIAWNYFGNLELDFIFRGEIILGYIANIIFVLLLLTSSQWSKKVLKKNWKRLHILVWAAVPLAFFHSNLAAVYYTGKINPLVAIAFGSLYLLAFLQLFFKKWQHFVILFVAWLISFALIALAYPETLGSFNQDLNPSSNSVSSSSSSSSSSSLNISSSSQNSVSGDSTDSSSNNISSSVVASSSPSTAVSSSSGIIKAILSSNNTASSCWVSFDKKVYNVTNYLGQHPGGRRELLRVCGQEIDSLSSGHQGGSFGSSKIQGILGEFYVADLV